VTLASDPSLLCIWPAWQNTKQNNKTLWPESVSELYRLGDQNLLAKLVPTFTDSGVSYSQRGRSSRAVISVFLTGPTWQQEQMHGYT
jgi:hypothetical protein